MVANYPWLKVVSENMGWVKGVAAFFGINILLRRRIKMWWDKTKIIAGTHVEVGVIKQTLTEHIAEQHRVNNEMGDKLDFIIKEIRSGEALNWALRNYDDDSYFACNPEGKIKIVSKSILKIIGCSREDFIAYGWFSFIKDPVERIRIRNLWDDAFENNTPFEESTTFTNNSGNHIHVIIKCSPVYSETDNCLQGWAGTFEKI
jgi:PAS domain-containing protein